MTLSDQVRDWLADDPDADDSAELEALVAASDWDALADRFAGPLTFGTAGLRGPLRAGPNGMNAAVVRAAAAGIAAHLSETGSSGGIVVIGYDGRHRSREFALDSARVFAAAGFRARLLPRLLPTPVLAFAVRQLGAVTGIMVTASHNPAADNGYKVYAGDGAQIVPPTDAQIEAHIRAVPSVRAIALSEDFEVLDDAVLRTYVAAVADLVPPDAPRDISIVHTAMHGVGSETVRAVFAAAGFAPLREVAAQAEPDADFPSVAFPNPEEHGAMDLALALAEDTGADLVLANDPDADRCAVGARFPSGWRMLRGDETGVLLADRLLTGLPVVAADGRPSGDVSLGRQAKRGTYATTIVSSSMLSEMASRHGVPFVETLTGFKWLSRAAPDLVYAYEEALGYAVAPQLVLDKDGISAALTLASLAAALAAAGSSIPQRLTELAAEYGLYATRQLSWRVTDLRLIADAMARWRSGLPHALLGEAVTVTDLAPDNDVLILRFDGGRVVIRPSGTEPKCKAYLEVVIADGSEAAADRALDALGAEISALVGL